MDYKEKYEMALERAKKFIEENPLVQNLNTWIKETFPELTESEDEKVRKALIEMVHDTTGDELWVDYNVHKEEALAWLEKQGESYTKRDVDDAWLKGMCDAKRELDKQSDSPIKWNKNTKDCKPKVSHSVLMKTTHGIAEGEWQVEHWRQYRWSCTVKDDDVLYWIYLSDLYSTMPYTFEKQSEQNSSWSKEDDVRLQACIDTLQAESICGKVDTVMTKWLKSLKTRCTWKPSDEQMADLWNMLCECRPADHQLLQDIYYGLKKLRENNL